MNTKLLQQFRDTVYQALPKRADATMDLLDALTAMGHVESLVAVSESVLFRRQFSSVYDVLEEGALPEADLRAIFSQYQPPEGETIAGYEVYAVDCTPRPSARSRDFAEAHQPEESKEPGGTGWRKVQLVGPIVQADNLLVAPQDIERVSPDTTDSEVTVR